jgi:hypothetical protein
MFNHVIAPLIWNSRIERIHETGLPKATVEKEGVIYCRMKADDFSFPIPPGTTVAGPIIISGIFDSVDGPLEVSYGATNQGMTADAYKSWVSKQVEEGGYIEAESISNGLKIHFHYFGDR